MGIKAKITVDRAAAIMAGRSEFGHLVVEIDPATLDAEQRAELVRATERHNVIDLTQLEPWGEGTWRSLPKGTLPDYPELTQADEAGVRLVLTVRADARAKAKAYEAERHAKFLADAEAKQRAWLAKPDDEMLILSAGTHYDWRVVEPPRDLPEAVPGVSERYRRLIQVRDQRIAEGKAEYFAELARKGEAATQAEQRKQALLATLGDAVLTDEQRRRRKAGVLPEKELMDAIRSEVFRPLDAFPRYQRLTAAEMCEAGVEAGEELEFGAGAVDEVDAETFATFEAIGKVARAEIPHSIDVTLRWHGGGAKSASEWVVTRNSVMVTVQLGEGIELSREYAAP